MTLAERRYQSYVRAYEKKKLELLQMGATIDPMYSRDQYKWLYKAFQRDYAKSKNLPKKIVENQARDYSPAQARARARAMKQAGLIEKGQGYASFKYATQANKQLDEALSARWQELKAEGIRGKAALEFLGVELFYSDADDLE